MFKPTQFFSEVLSQLGGLGFALLILVASCNTADAQQLIFPGPATAIRTTDMINVKLYGAVGNNVNDDTIALQNAINAVPLAPGGFRQGIVFIPTGTYKTTGTLFLDAGIFLYGAGRFASIISYTGAGVALALNGGQTVGTHTSPDKTAWYSTIQDLQVTSSTGTVGIQIGRARDITIWNCYIGGPQSSTTGFSTAAIHLTGDGTAQGGAQNIKIYNNWIQGGVDGIRIDNQLANANTIIGNAFSAQTGNVLHILSSGSGSILNTVFISNSITGNVAGGSLIEAQHVLGFTVSGNYLESATSLPMIKILSGSTTSGGIEITSNYFSGTGTASIEFQIGSSIAVRGNHQNGAVTNFVLATTPGAISNYSIQGAPNATNTFRNGAAGTTYAALLVSDTATFVNTTGGNTLTTQRDDNPALVVQSVTGAGHYAEIDVNSGAVGGRWFSDPTYQAGVGAVILGTSTNHQTIVRSNNTDRVTAAADGGVFIGAPTGATLGAGTLNVAGALGINGVKNFIPGAPTISSGFGTSPSVTGGNTAAFRVNVGTGGVATSGVIAMNATATTGWNCFVEDQTTANINTRQSASTTTTVTFSTSVAWSASDILIATCTAF